MKRYSWQARLFIGCVVLGGLGTLGYGASASQWNLDLRFLSLLIVALLASRLSVPLPELNSSMSVNLPFLLVAAAWLSLPAALIIGGAASLVQSIPTKKNSFRLVHALFNSSSMVIGIGASWAALNTGIILRASELPEKTLLLIVAMGIFFMAQTIPVTVILSLTEGASAFRTWLEIFTCTIPYYVLSAGLACIINLANQYVGWFIPLLSLPVMFGVYRSYRRYFRQPMMATVALAGGAAKSQAAGAM